MLNRILILMILCFTLTVNAQYNYVLNKRTGKFDVVWNINALRDSIFNGYAGYSIPVTNTGTLISLPSVVDSNYALTYNCYNSNGQINVTISSRTGSGFIVTACESANFDFVLQVQRGTITANDIYKSNIGDSSLYVWNDRLKITNGIFNRFTGNIYYVSTRNVIATLNNDWFVIIRNEFGDTLNDFAVGGSSGLLNYKWVVPNISPEFLAASTSYQDWAIGFGSYTASLNFGMDITPNDNVLLDIDGAALPEKYHIGVFNKTIRAFTNVDFINVSADLTPFTDDSLINCFSQVKFDSDTLYTTYIYAVGKNGVIIRGEKTDKYLGSLLNIKNSMDVMQNITHSLTTEDLRRVYFTSEDTGYIFGDNYTLLKTVNAGTTWTKINLSSILGYSTTLYDGMVAGNYAYLKLKRNSSAFYDVFKYTLP